MSRDPYEHWKRQHQAAFRNPRGIERGLLQLIQGMSDYAAAYHTEYPDSTLGDDGILGEGFADIVRGTLTLLNGSLGRLDGGSLDASIREIAAGAGLAESDY